MGFSNVMQYILTGLAGVAVGILALRLWQSSAAGGTIVSANSGAELETGGELGTGNTQPTKAWFSGKIALPAWLGRLNLRPSSILLLGAAAILAASLAIHFLRGGSTGEGATTAPTQSVAGLAGAELDDVETMIQRLAARLEANPDDGEGFRMLGWSYLMTDKPELALAPYQRALELLPDSAGVHAGHGETLVALADGTVTPEAKAAFDRALTLDPVEPRARYFEGLWEDQHGRQPQALDAWVALVKAGPADAPWQAEVRTQIARLESELGVDAGLPPLISSVAGATAGAPQIDAQAIEAASSLPAGEREAMVDDMVGRLAARLAANPQDPEGWVRLIRSRMVLGQGDQAARDLASARTALSGNAAALAQLSSVAAETSVPGA